MKDKFLKQLTQSLEAFGVSATQVATQAAQAAEVMLCISPPMRQWEKRLIESQHQSRCVKYAHTLSIESCPVKKQIIWNLFKQL